MQKEIMAGLLKQSIIHENKDILIDLLFKIFPDLESIDCAGFAKYIQIIPESSIVLCKHDPSSSKKTTIIEKLYTEAKEKFTNIPGSYMLSDTEKEQFIDKLFSAACLKHISQTQPKLLFALKSVLKEESFVEEKFVERVINRVIDRVAKTYKIPDEHFENITKSKEPIGFRSRFFGSYNPLTTIEELIKNYQDGCNNIIGFDMLSRKERDKFLNELIVLQERIRKNSSLFTMSSLEKKELLWNRKVEKAINKKFMDEKFYQDLGTLKKSIEANLIDNLDLRQDLEKQLLNAMLEKLKNDKYKPELTNNNGITDVCLKIIIAKYLSNIYSFNQMSNREQIDKINSLLEIIQEERSKRSSNSNHQDFNSKVSQMIDELLIKESYIYKTAIEDVGLKDPESTSTFYNMLNKASLFLRSPSVKAAFKGAATAVLAANAIPLMPSAPINSLLALTGHNTNDQLHSISPATSVSAAGVGMILGYKYHNKVNNIFPIEYLITEIADIYNNDEKKSPIDRLIRSVPIVTTFGAGVFGIATVLTTNAVSIPLLSGIALGGLVSVPVVAAFSKLANKVSQKVHGLLYGVTNPSYYEFTEDGKFLLGNNTDNINKVVEFFKTHIELLNKALEVLGSEGTRANEMDVLQLNNIIDIIKKAFKALKNGDNTKEGVKSFDDAIGYIIAYQKDLAVDRLKEISTEEILDNIAQLLNISDIYQSLVLIKLNDTVQARLKKIKSTNTEIVENLDAFMKEIVSIYNIVKPSKRTDSSNLLDLQTSDPNHPTSIATSSNSTNPDLTKRTPKAAVMFIGIDGSRGRSANRQIEDDRFRRSRSCSV